MNIWDIMAPAFIECLILVGIHSYLGIHVIKRKVIFVDLALAQVAALGTTVGFLFGIFPGTSGAYWFSLGFAIFGAAVFSISRLRNEKIPQEAVIGLVYAIAAALIILVIDKAPHGAEHIKEMLTGSILWVKWSTIGEAALVYAFIGLFHYIFREKFILISNNPEEAYEKGISVRFWDFLFYVSFGIVITYSVGTAGVLLVFVFLVVPAIASILITDVLWKQLVIGWSMGLVVSVLGLYISYIADLPSGPTVVAFYGLMLLIVALTLYAIRAKNRLKALGYIGLGFAVTLLIFLFFKLMGVYFQSHVATHEQPQFEMKEGGDKTTNLGTVKSQILDNSDLHGLIESYEKTDDASEKLDIIKKIVPLDEKSGIKLLTRLLGECHFPFICQEGLAILEEKSGQRFGYDPEKSSSENAVALEKISEWYKKYYP